MSGLTPMTAITVTTQAELDAALRRDDLHRITIDSTCGVWIRLSNNGISSATVEAWDSATVEAWSSATVEAWGSATVRAWGSATVEAWDSATVEAWGSATVRAWGSATVEAWDSATVEASDSATVEAWDSATVEAWDSATVEAWGSATVRAWGSATVEASDSATVEAWDSATVEASDSATVRAGSHVAVHLHSGRATVSGGVLIDHTAIDLTDPQTWCDYHGVTVVDGIATLYKAVGDNWSTARGADYSPGSLPEAPDWRDDHQYGGGLHFSPHPRQSRSYYPEATRYLAVGVASSADLRPIAGGTPKAKAPRVVVAGEVDIHTREVTR